MFRMALQTLKRESCLGWMRREILGGDLHASIIGTVGEGIGGTASGCRLCPVPRYCSRPQALLVLDEGVVFYRGTVVTNAGWPCLAPVGLV